MKANELTETEYELYEMLKDGRRHNHAELRTCLPNSLSGSLAVHICYLRKKLEPNGLTVMCYSRPGVKGEYRLVRLIEVD